MEPQQQDILQRYYQRLSENLEPADLMKSLVTVGAIEDEVVQSVLQDWLSENEQKRETHTEWLLDSLRNRKEGMNYLVQGLLLSEIQDFLAREIIEDDYFTEQDVAALFESLKEHLTEVQILKLELIKERKKHDETRKQLEDVKSNRTSAVFSDYDGSCCSGYDSSNVTSLLRELEEEKKCRQVAEKRTDELVESHEDMLRHIKSLEDVRFSGSPQKNLPWKAASLADLCWPEQSPPPFDFVKNETKWPSIDSGTQMRDFSSHRNSFGDVETTGVVALAERVSILESQLEQEIDKRQEAECEVTKLEIENRSLHEELFETHTQLFETHDELLETRDQLLATSQLDILEEDDQRELWDEKDYLEQGASCADSLSLICDEFSFDRRASCPSLPQAELTNHNPEVQLRHGVKQRMGRPVSYHGNTNISHMWQNRNIDHYEMDQYDNEIQNSVDPRDKDFRYALRRLKLDTWKLYNDVLLNGEMIKSTTDRLKILSTR